MSVEPLEPGEPLNVTDVVFLQEILGHYLGAAQLAKLAVDRGSSDQVRQAGLDIRRDSAEQIRRISLWLSSIGIDPRSVSAVGHDHGGSAQDDITELGSLSGADFDRSVVDLMLKHSLGAVEICKAEAQTGSQHQVREFAAAVAARESDRVVRLADGGS